MPMLSHRRSPSRRAAAARALVVLAAVAAAGCTPPWTDWSDVNRPKQIEVEAVTMRHGVVFAPGSARLSPEASTALDAFLDRPRVARTPRLTLAQGAAGDPLARHRREAVADHLERRGFDVERVAGAGDDAPEGTVTVLAHRHVVILPSCPDWSMPPGPNYANTVNSNFGCATATNFGLMVADPTDIVRGRDAGPADGEVMAGAVQRYRAGKTKPLLTESTGEMTTSPESGSDGGQ